MRRRNGLADDGACGGLRRWRAGGVGVCSWEPQRWHSSYAIDSTRRSGRVDGMELGRRQLPNAGAAPSPSTNEITHLGSDDPPLLNRFLSMTARPRPCDSPTRNTFGALSDSTSAKGSKSNRGLYRHWYQISTSPETCVEIKLSRRSPPLLNHSPSTRRLLDGVAMWVVPLDSVVTAHREMTL